MHKKRTGFIGAVLAFIFALPAVAAEVPPTIPHPGINGDNGFVIGLTNLDTRTLLWRAPYLYETPYVVNSGWLPGDRVGYGCAYGFLEHNGEIIGRFTARAIPGAADYMRVNDTFMEEGVRWYDGLTTPPINVQVPAFECPEVTESYQTQQVPDERPVVVYWHDNEAIEIRDYRTIDPAPGVTFDLVAEIREPFTITSPNTGRTHTVNNRITVVAREAGVPEILFYYDSLGEGSMFPTDDPEPNDDCNAVISMSQGAQVYSGSQAGAGDTADSELEAATGEEWMLLFAGGKPLKFWASAALWNQLSERHRCGTDAEIDQVLFIFDPRGSANPWTNDLNKAIAIMRTRYPNAAIDVSLLVGANNHVVCTINQRGRVVNVTATQTHNNANAATVAAHPNAGPDLDVACSGFADALGHLNNGGAADAQGQVAAFYGP